MNLPSVVNFIRSRVGSCHVDAYLGASYGVSGKCYTVQALDGDPVGSATLTLTNIVSGSEIRLYDNVGTELTGGVETIAGTTIIFTYNVYQNPTNGYYVILKAGYRPMRKSVSLVSTPQSIQVSQQIDSAYIP